MSSQDRFERFVGRSGSYRDITITGTEENYLINQDGERVVDFIAGWCVVNAGYGRQEIIRAAKDASEDAAYVKPSYQYAPVVELAEKLSDITPGDLSHTFRLTSGTEAVEASIKAARGFTGRKEIIANENAYHGTAYGAMTLGNFDESYGPFLQNVTKIPSPHDMAHDEWITRFEELCKEKQPAAYITETILTHQGVYLPEEGHYEDVQRICDEYGVLLVLDEVANGFGRTGEMFAANHYAVEPDIMTFAKGFSSGYAPIGAMITTQEVGQEISDTGGTYATFGWTPEAVAVARKNIDIIENEDLPAQAQKTGERMKPRIKDIDGVTNVYQTGLLIGVELDEPVTKDLRESGVNNGVLTGTTNEDDVLLLAPPLNIDETYVDDGIERLREASSNVL